MYGYDVLKSLYKSQKEHTLTQEEYLALWEGTIPKLDKDASNSFRVERKTIYKPTSGKGYNELLVVGKNNEVLKRLYLKKEVTAPVYNYKEHPSNYLSVFDTLEEEDRRFRTYENGGDM